MGRRDFIIGSRDVFIAESDAVWSDLKKYVPFSAVAPPGAEKRVLEV